jgi:hypothetical protein
VVSGNPGDQLAAEFLKPQQQLAVAPTKVFPRLAACRYFTSRVSRTAFAGDPPIV